mmetsp:Transcript_56460/g.89931  ORF Transcript_56460/g.89931 Transcript_56460/m.89931 type:complete len:252 (-) Transcript_56460:36-791(-)
MGGQIYRPSTEPNTVTIDTTTRAHNYDPLGNIYTAIKHSKCFANTPLYIESALIKVVVHYVGYTESNLHLKSHSSNITCSAQNVGQLFLFTMPKHPKTSYTLTSFATDIKVDADELATAQFCATLLLFEKERLENNDNDIVWQSKIFTAESATYLASTECDDEHYVHSEYNANIVRFANIDIRLEAGQTYAVKIDVPAGNIGCNVVEESVKWKTKNRRVRRLVDSSGYWMNNVYGVDYRNNEDKLYELVLC